MNEQSLQGSNLSPHPRGASKAALRHRLHLLLALADTVCVVVGFALSSLIRTGGRSFGDASQIIVVLLPVYLTVAVSLRAYAVEVLQDSALAVGRSVRALLLSAVMVVFIAFYLKASTDLSRLMLALGCVITFGLLTLVRRALVRNATSLLGGNPYSVILISDGVPPPMIDGVVVVSTDIGDTFDPHRHDPIMYDRLATVLEAADRVVVACPPERRYPWAQALKGAAIQGEILMPELDAVSPLGMGEHDKTPTLIVAKGPLGLGDRMMKRAFDIAFAGAVLLLVSPLMLLVALAIKRSSPGPVLFVQTRIGRGNRIFQVFKFRSMRVEASDGAGDRSASRDDDRITPVGRIIRATSIDELPQLLNVLKGDMSIVGPRPHALGSRAEEQLFWEIDQRYWHRHSVKPGLTGLAQVRGFRGATLRRDDLINRLQADLEYVNGWTVWRDLVILARTVTVVLHKNAY